MRLVKLFDGDRKTRREIVKRSVREFFEGDAATPADAYRVAYLSPSGRPVLTRGTRPCEASISFAHVDMLTAVAIDDRHSIGIDLVPLRDSPSLQDWATGDRTGELPSSGGPAFCWAAREAAYKATALDVPFRPDSFAFSVLNADVFLWTFRDDGQEACGEGRFALHGSVVCALAVRNSVWRGEQR